MKKKRLLIIASIILLLILTICVICYLTFTKVYIMEPLKAEDILTIELRNEKISAPVFHEDDVNKFLEIFASNERRTRKKYSKMFFKGYTERIEIRINTHESTLDYTITNKDNKYYIKGKSDGIFKISKKEYENIKSFFTPENVE